MEKLVTLRPRVSEKAYNLSENNHVYIFEVPAESNKHTVKKAVETQFSVNVTEVNILVTKGKSVSRYQKRGGRITGKRAGVKKAYITLKEGQEIAIFPKEEDKANEQAAPAKSKKARRSVK